MIAFRKWLWDSGADFLIILVVYVCAIAWVVHKYPAQPEYVQPVGYVITITVAP